ncbi:MAG: DUF91 domain-containing protein [Acidobacteria bacterium]|nr:DUF91 domain-containing protein [Acidobacteriota bacterium]
MISQPKLQQWVSLYLKHIEQITPEVHVRDEEGYKFRSVDTFQRKFNIDAPDLAAMLARAIENNNLVVGNMFFPRRMLLIFAETYPEQTRQALRMLLDETRHIAERMDQAFELFEGLMDRRNKELGTAAHSYVGLRFLSLLLGFRYPNVCNAIKPREWKVFCRFVDDEFSVPQGTSTGKQYMLFEPYIESLRTHIKRLPEIRNLRDELTRGLAFHDEEYRWLTQDVIFVTARVLARSKDEHEAGHEVVQEPAPEEEGDGEAVVPAVPAAPAGVRFPLEEYLENLIVKNWAHIEFCRNLEFFTDEDGTPGQQYVTDVGIIDLLAKDKTTGDLVVIELKRGNADSRVIGQVLAYIDWVERNLAMKGQNVRGIVIVADGSKALFAAQRQVSRKVSVRYYRVNLDICEPPEPASE